LVRPWVGGLGILLCGLAWLGVEAYRADFEGGAVCDVLARASAAASLEGIAVALHLKAADLYRAQVHALRAEGASRAELRATRYALADQVKAAGLILWRQGELRGAAHYLDAAVKAAPERLDLKCLLIQARVKTGEEPDLRLALLRLAYRHDAACAHYLLGRMFLEEGRSEEAAAYLERAIQKAPGYTAAHLLLAEVRLRNGNREGAVESAGRACESARNLREMLAAHALIQRLDSEAPARAVFVAEAYWYAYRYVALTVAALLVFLFHPAIGKALRRGDRIRH